MKIHLTFGENILFNFQMENCKVVKSPMFLEIVEYKLKNRIYHKVEHAVKDFRRVINNARFCHQVRSETSIFFSFFVPLVSLIIVKAAR